MRLVVADHDSPPPLPIFFSGSVAPTVGEWDRSRPTTQERVQDGGEQWLKVHVFGAADGCWDQVGQRIMQWKGRPLPVMRVPSWGERMVRASCSRSLENLAVMRDKHGRCRRTSSVAHHLQARYRVTVREVDPRGGRRATGTGDTG